MSLFGSSLGRGSILKTSPTTARGSPTPAATRTTSTTPAVQPSTSPTTPPAAKEPSGNTLLESQVKLLRNPAFSDLTVICGDRTWKCQRAILSQRCDFFRAACGLDFKESEAQEIVLNEDNPIGVDQMLVYLYTLDVPKFQGLGDAYHTHTVSDKYNLPTLKQASKSAVLKIVRTHLPNWAEKDDIKKEGWIGSIKTLWRDTTDDSAEFKLTLLEAIIPSAKHVVDHEKFRQYALDDTDFLWAFIHKLVEEATPAAPL